jgi:hypothetical protein
MVQLLPQKDFAFKVKKEINIERLVLFFKCKKENKSHNSNDIFIKQWKIKN